MLMLAITPARMKSAPAAVTIQPARLRPFWPWFAAVKPRSAFQRSPEGRGSEHGWGIPSGAAQAGFTGGSGLRPILRRAKHVGVWLADGDEGRKEKKEVMEAGKRTERRSRKTATTATRTRKMTMVMMTTMAMAMMMTP